MFALIGSGEYLPEMEPVDRDLIGRLPEPARVVCLPTAAGREGPERVAYWSRLGVDHFTRLNASVKALPVIDRASANDGHLADAIAASNCIYLSGGKPDYLYTTLENSLAWEAVLSVLAGGGLLAGCSAGAMILGEKFFAFPGLKSGFNFLSHVIVIPHYGEIPKSFIKTAYALVEKKLTVLGIEANTVLVCKEKQYEVLSSGGVIIRNGTGTTLYTRGPLPPGVLANDVRDQE